MQDEDSLLQLLPTEVKMHVANKRPDYALRPDSGKMGVEYQENMKEGLKNLGLYQMVNVHHCLIERGLITALVERWRPETNTFHLSVGECTVTLEDVSCLWGLSVTGNIFSVELDYQLKMTEKKKFTRLSF